MASSAEAVELADGSADDGGNVGGVGSNERSPEPSDTEVLIVDEDTLSTAESAMVSTRSFTTLLDGQ